MPSPDDERGVPRERTGLAWERSALAYVALAALMLGVAAHRDAPGLIPVGVALAAVGGAVWRHGQRQYGWKDVAAQPRAVALMALATALTAVAAAIVVIARL
jgi:uncharacterized membrane protein YidH (DUF202 family)